MIGMVLVTHGQLATGFRAAFEHVVGPQSRFETITIGPEDDMEQRRADILSAVARVQDGSGVVLLTDMFGGTPSNLAISVMDGGRDRGHLRHQSADADQARHVARQRRPRPRRDRGARRRSQIHHGRKQGAGRQMSEASIETDETDCPPAAAVRRGAACARCASSIARACTRARPPNSCNASIASTPRSR